jgi:hypothetical protein
VQCLWECTGLFFSVSNQSRRLRRVCTVYGMMQQKNVQYTQSYMPKRWLRVTLVARKYRYNTLSSCRFRYKTFQSTLLFHSTFIFKMILMQLMLPPPPPVGMGLLVWAPHFTEKPWCDLDVAKWWAMTVRNRLGCPTGITLRGRIWTFFKERGVGGGHKGHPWAEGVFFQQSPFHSWLWRESQSFGFSCILF